MNLTSEIFGLWISLCWQLTLLIIMASILGMTCLRNRPHLMNVLWIIVFVKALTIPLWSSPTSLFSWIEPRYSQGLMELGYLSPAPSPVVEHPDSALHVATYRSVDSASMSTERVPGFTTVLVGIWAAGVLLLLSLASQRWTNVVRSLRRASRAGGHELQATARRLTSRLGMSRRVRILVSQANLGPMVFGSYRPVLVLPEVLVDAKSPAELEPIIAHELLHARRGDTTLGALQFVAQLLWWFHPLVWWASRQSNRVSERCCDEEVLAYLRCKPSDYARCLLDTLELRAHLQAVPALPGIRSNDITHSRLENICLKKGPFHPTSRRRHVVVAVVLAFLLLPGGGMLAHAWQDPEPISVSAETGDLSQQADRAAANKDWVTAAKHYRALTVEDDDNGRAWFMLGYCLHASGNIAEAIDAHRRATAFDRTKPTAYYNLACAYALSSQREAALEALQHSVDAGFVSSSPITHDPDFESIQSDPEFLRLAEAAMPSADREVYRQFDFWIGTWDVFARDGSQAGTNVITKDEKGFLLTEKWTNNSGSTGTSISYYDPSDQCWKQTWVDAGGNIVRYRGGYRDGNMRFEGSLTKPSGARVASRVTYHANDDGSIRQLIEHSSDSGRNWSVYFDGKYVRRIVGVTDIQGDGAT